MKGIEEGGREQERERDGSRGEEGKRREGRWREEESCGRNEY